MTKHENTAGLPSRADDRSSVSRLLQRLIVDADSTQDEVARYARVQAQLVQRWCDKNRPETITVADTPRVPFEIGIGLVRWQAENLALPQLVSQAPVPGDIESDIEHLGKLASQVGKVSEAFANAIKDGSISADDADRIVKSGCEALETILALVNRAKEARADISKVHPIRNGHRNGNSDR